MVLSLICAVPSRAVGLPSGLRVLLSLLLFCLVSTSLSAPCPLKDHVAIASLSFVHQWNVSPILWPELPRGIVHLRRGLHPHRYHLHARRAPLLKMRATTELIGPARRIPSTRSAACRVLSDEGVLPGCFYLATLEDASWLNKIQSLSVVVYEDTLAVNRTSGLSVNRTGARIKPVAKTSSLASRRQSPEEALKFAVCGTHLQ